MAWAIVRCSRDYIQQEAEAKAAGGGVHSHDGARRGRRQGRISGRQTRFGGDQVSVAKRRGNRLSESFWGVLNVDSAGALPWAALAFQVRADCIAGAGLRPRARNHATAFYGGSCIYFALPTPLYPYQNISIN